MVVAAVRDRHQDAAASQSRLDQPRVRARVLRACTALALALCGRTHAWGQRVCDAFAVIKRSSCVEFACVFGHFFFFVIQGLLAFYLELSARYKDECFARFYPLTRSCPSHKRACVGGFFLHLLLLLWLRGKEAG